MDLINNFSEDSGDLDEYVSDFCHNRLEIIFKLLPNSVFTVLFIWMYFANFDKLKIA